MAEGNFSVEDSRLTVTGELQAGSEEGLRRACEQLLGCSHPKLVVDLSAVRYVHSLSVGMLSYAWVEALTRDKELEFIVSPEVSDVFERTGLSKVFSYRVQG